MDAALVVLAVALLAVVLANVVITFGAMGALRDTTLKLTALRDPGAADAVAARRQPAGPPAEPMREDAIDPALWNTDYARDLDATPGNGRT